MEVGPEFLLLERRSETLQAPLLQHHTRSRAAFLSPLVKGHKIDLGVGGAKIYPHEVPRAANFITNEAACNDCGEQTSKPLHDTRVQQSATEASASTAQLEPISRYETQPLIGPDNSADADLFVSKAGKAQMGPTYAVISDSAANVLHLQ